MSSEAVELILAGRACGDVPAAAVGREELSRLLSPSGRQARLREREYPVVERPELPIAALAHGGPAREAAQKRLVLCVRHSLPLAAKVQETVVLLHLLGLQGQVVPDAAQPLRRQRHRETALPQVLAQVGHRPRQLEAWPLLALQVLRTAVVLASSPPEQSQHLRASLEKAVCRLHLQLVQRSRPRVQGLHAALRELGREL
mmetsp:Transcript_33084/g.102696  ORF Transcript_33084/g.102696 Transcript_33084/m.102696 type:complete len:201 (+) Transcript_33084:681-1283(+)